MTKPVNRLGLGRRGCCWLTGPSAKIDGERFKSCFGTVGFHCTCCPWPMCAVRWHASCVRQGFFSISSCPQRRRWLMVLLSFSFVACHNPSHVILFTIYRQEDAAAFPAFLCGLRVGVMLTRRSCMGIRGRLRLAPALAQATYTARMFICLHCDHTCLQKSLSFAPGVVVLHRLPLTPTWSTSHRSLDFVQQNRCQCVYGLVARSGSNPQPFAPSSCTTCKKAQGSIAVQALELPNENQTRIRTPCTKLFAFPRYGIFFFKFKFELRGKTVSKKTQMGKSLCLIREPDIPK